MAFTIVNTRTFSRTLRNYLLIALAGFSVYKGADLIKDGQDRAEQEKRKIEIQSLIGSNQLLEAENLLKVYSINHGLGKIETEVLEVKLSQQKKAEACSNFFSAVKSGNYNEAKKLSELLSKNGLINSSEQIKYEKALDEISLEQRLLKVNSTVGEAKIEAIEALFANYSSVSNSLQLRQIEVGEYSKLLDFCFTSSRALEDVYPLLDNFINVLKSNPALSKSELSLDSLIEKGKNYLLAKSKEETSKTIEVGDRVVVAKSLGNLLGHDGSSYNNWSGFSLGDKGTVIGEFPASIDDNSFKPRSLRVRLDNRTPNPAHGFYFITRELRRIDDEYLPKINAQLESLREYSGGKR